MRGSILTALAVAIVAGCGKDDGAADFEKGMAAYAARDLRAAAGLFGSAAEKNPTNFMARIRLALANIDLGEMPSAKAAVESALALEPQSAEARLVDGQIAFYTRDYSRARKDFNAVAEAMRLPPAIRSQALSELAVVEISENNFDMARLALWRAVRLDRKNAAAWYHLGHLSRDTYRFENAALEQFEMAGRLIKDQARAKAIAHKVIPALRESLRAKMASKPRASTRDPATAAKLVTEGEALLKKDPKRASAKFAEAYSRDPLSYAAALNCAKATSASAKTDSAVDKALAARMGELEDVNFRGGVLMRRPAVFDIPDAADKITWNSWHMSGIERKACMEGFGFYSALRYSEYSPASLRRAHKPHALCGRCV